MSGLERTSDLKPVLLTGSPEHLSLLEGWEPADPDALLMPIGSIAEIEPGSDFSFHTLDSDFRPRTYVRVWVRITSPDGRRGLVPGGKGMFEVPPNTPCEVFFRPVGSLDSPNLIGNLSSLFRSHLGPDADILHSNLNAEIMQSGNYLRRRLEPAALDERLRPAFWRFYGYIESGRELVSNIENIAGRYRLPPGELSALVNSVRDQAFREGVAVGREVHGAQLAKGLEREVRERRASKKRHQRVGGKSGLGDRKSEEAEASWRAISRAQVWQELDVEGLMGTRGQVVADLIEGLKSRQEKKGDISLPKKKKLVSNEVEKWLDEWLRKHGHKFS